MIGFERSVAVVIGIDEYGRGIPSLKTAVNDARAVAAMLESRFGYVVHLLIEDVSLERLRTLFGRVLPGEITKDDRLLVYFAGHGVALDGDDGPDGFLIPQDGRPEDPGSFLRMTELAAGLDSLPCRHLLLILDCCFAGAFRWSSTRDLGTLPEVIHKERYLRFIEDRAWQVLTSAAHDQKALDVIAGETIDRRGNAPERPDHSPFAAALLRALEGEADLVPRPKDGQPGGDGVITATELYLYLRECVEVGVRERGHRQTPGLWPLKNHDKGEFIHLVDPGREPDLPAAPELTDEANPWRGLQSYEEGQAPLYFGRRRVIRALHRRVRTQPLTIVLGASGTGKSSLVKAGWMPRIRRIKSGAWRPIPAIRPGKSPLTSLASMVLPGEADGPDATAARLAEARADAGSLARRVEGWVAIEPGSRGRLVIVVDQFEELLSLCWDPPERRAFLEQLQAATAACPDRLRVVLTLRSDFEPQFADTPLKASWMGCRFVVPPMSLDEYREAIEGPASVRVLYFHGREGSQKFISRLVEDVANTPGALPLLSFALSELYRRYLARRGNDRGLSERDYDALGGVGGSLRNRAEEIYASFGPKDKPAGEGEPPATPHQDALRRVMLRMVSVEGGDLARRRLPQSELVYDDRDENRRVADVVRSMVEARLVIPGKDEEDQPIFEPAHDELIRGWSRLQQWLRDARDSLALRQLLTPAARDWSRDHPPDPGKLWHANPRLGLLASELGLLLEWPRHQWNQIKKLATRGPDIAAPQATWLNRDETRFVARSLDRRHRTTSIVALTTTLTVVVLAALTGFALNSRARAVERANLARSRELAVRSTAVRDTRLDRALLLGAEALQTFDTFEARSALFEAFAARPGLRAFLHSNEGSVTDIAYSPDGRTIAVGCSGSNHGGAVTLWDSSSHRPRIERPLAVDEGPVRSLAFSPDGSTLAASFDRLTEEDGVVVWETATYTRRTKDYLPVPEANVTDLVFSRDGTSLAAGAELLGGGGLITWDVASLRRQPEEPFGYALGSVQRVARSPDGRTFTAGFVAILGSGAGTIRCDVRTLRPEIEEPTPFDVDMVRNIALSDDGRTLAAWVTPRDGKGDGGMMLWDVESQKPLTERPVAGPPGVALALAFSPDGRTLAGGFDGEGGVVLWDVKTRRVLTERPLLVPGRAVTSLAFSPDDRTLASGFGGGVVLWDLDRVRRVDRRVAVSSEWIKHLDFGEDGRSLLAFEYSQDPKAHFSYPQTMEQKVLIYDLPSGRLTEHALQRPVPSYDIEDATICSDGRVAVAAFRSYQSFGIEGNGGVAIWYITGEGTKPRPPLTFREGSPTRVAFSPDGRTLAIGLDSGKLVLWNMAEWRSMTDRPLEAGKSRIWGLAFSPSGEDLAVGTGEGVVLLNVRDGRKWTEGPLTLSDGKLGSVQSLAFSPDGRTLAAAVSDGYFARAAELWSLTDRIASPQRRLFPSEGYVSDLSFSPNGQMLGAIANGLVLWDAASWRLLTRRSLRNLGELESHAPAQDRIPSPSKDGQTELGLTGPLAFSRDGRVMAVYSKGGGRREIAIVDIVPASDRVARASAMANRNFSLSEWQEYFGADVPYHRTNRSFPDGEGVPIDLTPPAKWPLWAGLVILWLVFWLRFDRWAELIGLVRQGAWVSLLIGCAMAAAAWGLTSRPTLSIAGHGIPSVIEKGLLVALLVTLAATCGWFRTRRNSSRPDGIAPQSPTEPELRDGS